MTDTIHAFKTKRDIQRTIKATRLVENTIGQRKQRLPVYNHVGTSVSATQQIFNIEVVSDSGNGVYVADVYNDNWSAKTQQGVVVIPVGGAVSDAYVGQKTLASKVSTVTLGG